MFNLDQLLAANKSLPPTQRIVRTSKQEPNIPKPHYLSPLANKVTVKGITYASTAEAAVACGITLKQLRYRLLAKRYPDYEYVDTENVIQRRNSVSLPPRSTFVDGVEYDTLRAACRDHGITEKVARRLLRTDGSGWKRKTKEQTMEKKPTVPTKKQSEEHLKKRIEALTGKKRTGQALLNLQKANRRRAGTHLTPDHKAKIAETLKKRDNTEHAERLREIAKSRVGKPIPPDQLAKSIEGRKKKRTLRKLSAEGVLYNSAKEASEALGITTHVVYNRVRSKIHPDYYYVA